jgi:ribonuclease P protein component
VLADGRRFSGQGFLLQARPNQARGARLGIIAGRKAVARAVDRNRSKRLVREAFRAASKELGALDVIVICRQPVPRGGSAQARRELDRLFARAAVGGERSARC